MALAPTRTAASKADMVFSGYWDLKPRWAMVCGMRRGVVRVDGWDGRGREEAMRGVCSVAIVLLLLPLLL